MSAIVWVTGAGKGLGRAVATLLVERGNIVAVSARTEADLSSLAVELGTLPGTIAPYPHDVTDADAVERSVAAVESELGPIDVAILNAGTHTPTPVKEFSVSAVRGLVEVNLMGTVHGLAALLPRMMARGDGHIAIVSSSAGFVGLPSAAAYGATKAALINMCEALKPELEPYGVRIQLITPGFVRTPLTDRNPFPMPFLMEPEVAAARIVRGLNHRRFEVTFPRRFTCWLKLLRVLPYPIQFMVTRRLIP